MSQLNSKSTPLIVISGPSGSGKTTICRRIAQDFGLFFSISHTTRPQRENEIQNKDYFFVSQDEFLKMKDRGDLLEWAQVYDNYYGTSKKQIEDHLHQGDGVIFDVDTQGATNIKKFMPQSLLIFIKTPSIDILKERLRLRGRDSDQEISKRVKNAQSEMAHIDEYDHVVVNDKLDKAIEDVKNIIKSK